MAAQSDWEILVREYVDERLQPSDHVQNVLLIVIQSDDWHIKDADWTVYKHIWQCDVL